MPIDKKTELWDRKTYCVFDIETTGLSPEFDDIIEIAVIKYRDGKKIDSFSSFLKSTPFVPKEITDLTGITIEDLNEKGIPVKKAMKKFSSFIEGSLLMAHNGRNFDMKFIDWNVYNSGLKEIEQPLLDTFLLSKALFGGYSGHKLKDLCERAGIEYPKTAHRAAVDAEITWEVFKKYLEPELEKKGVFLGKDKFDFYEIVDTIRHHR